MLGHGQGRADFDEEGHDVPRISNGIPCKIRDSPRVSTWNTRTRSWNPWTKETTLRSLVSSVSGRPEPRSISNRGSRSHGNIIFFRRLSGKVFGSSDSSSKQILHNHQDFFAIAQRVDAEYVDVFRKIG